MEGLNNGGWNSNEIQANFAAYVLDHIMVNTFFDPKDDNCDKLKEQFVKLCRDPVLIHDFKKVIYQDNLVR